MPRIQLLASCAALLSIIAMSVHADPIMQSGPEREAMAKKQNSLIGRTFSERGGNAFGSGLVSVGYQPHSRTTVTAYFMGVTADYGKGVIMPGLVFEDAATKQTQQTGKGLDVAYVNCKSKTYSWLPFPEFSELSNAERSWFVVGKAGKWAALEDYATSSTKWTTELSLEGAKDMTRFFSDLCEATY